MHFKNIKTSEHNSTLRNNLNKDGHSFNHGICWRRRAFWLYCEEKKAGWSLGHKIHATNHRGGWVHPQEWDSPQGFKAWEFVIRPQ